MAGSKWPGALLLIELLARASGSFTIHFSVKVPEDSAANGQGDGGTVAFDPSCVTDVEDMISGLEGIERVSTGHPNVIWKKPGALAASAVPTTSTVLTTSTTPETKGTDPKSKSTSTSLRATTTTTKRAAASRQAIDDIGPGVHTISSNDDVGPGVHTASVNSAASPSAAERGAREPVGGSMARRLSLMSWLPWLVGSVVLLLFVCLYAGRQGGPLMRLTARNGFRLANADELWCPQAIVVPGGGLTKDGRLMPWVEERLRRAKSIYDKSRSKGDFEAGIGAKIVTMCEGIRHSIRDPRAVAGRDGDSRTSRVLESQTAAQFLLKLGVPAEDVVSDDLSLDTVGNAYFLRTTHSDVMNARNMVIVTNDFHAARAKVVFEKIYSLSPMPADKENGYNIKFDIVKNFNIQPQALQRRIDWEAQQLKFFTEASANWVDLQDVHQYIFGLGEDLAVRIPERDASPSPVGSPAPSPLSSSRNSAREPSPAPSLINTGRNTGRSLSPAVTARSNQESSNFMIQDEVRTGGGMSTGLAKLSRRDISPRSMGSFGPSLGAPASARSAQKTARSQRSGGTPSR